jgi:hypothetical protein
VSVLRLLGGYLCADYDGVRRRGVGALDGESVGLTADTAAAVSKLLVK